MRAVVSANQTRSPGQEPYRRPGRRLRTVRL